MAMIEIKGASAGPGLLAYAEAIETVFESACRNRVDQSVLLEAVRGLNLAAKAEFQGRLAYQRALETVAQVLEEVVEEGR